MKINIRMSAVAASTHTLLTEAPAIKTSKYLNLKKPLTVDEIFKTHTYKQMVAAEDFIGTWLDDQTDAGRDKAAFTKMQKNPLYRTLSTTFDNLETALKEARKLDKASKKGTGKSSKVPEFILDPDEAAVHAAAKKLVEKVMGHSNWAYDPDLVDGGTSMSMHFMSGDKTKTDALKAALVKAGYRLQKQNNKVESDYKKGEVSVFLEGNEQVILSAPLITNPKWKPAPTKRSYTLYD